jgi:hypothetical protein
VRSNIEKKLNYFFIYLGGVLPHINSFLFKTKSGSDDHAQSAPKVNTSRSNATPAPRAPSALTTKAASTGGKAGSSSVATTKKTASVPGGNTATSA